MQCLVVTNDSVIKSSFSRELGASGHECIVVSSVMAATAIAEELNPRVVLVDVLVPAAGDFVKWIKRETGSAVVAILKDAPAQSPDYGADATVKYPLSAAALDAAFEAASITGLSLRGDLDIDSSFWDITHEVSESAAGVGVTPDRDPRRSEGELLSDDVAVISQEVIAVWGAKGGEGRTTVALCLADRLRSFEVLLVDMNFTEGPSDISTILDLPPLPHMGKLVDNTADRRQGFMDSLSKPKRADFAVVQPPSTIDQAENISPEDIVDLIDQARRMFQIIIIDLPNNLSPLTLEALDLSTAVICVASDHYGGLARLETWKSFVRNDITKALLINRSKNGDRKAREYAHWLEMPLAGRIEDYAGAPYVGGKDDFLKYWREMTYPAVSDILKLLFGLEMASRHPRRTLSKRIRGAIHGIVG